MIATMLGAVRLFVAAVLVGGVQLAGCAFAQAQSQVPAPAPEAPSGKAAREQELREVTERLSRSEAEQSRLRSEIAGLKGDRAKLNAELLKSAETVRRAEERVAESQGRLEDIEASEAALRRSLDGRRGKIADVLAALQRMSRRPPPAVLVRPEDMLEAVRAAILLGQVLPEMRSEAESLVADLTELVRLREAQAGERKRFVAERDAIAGERARLAALVEARQSQIESNEKALAEERGRIDSYGRQAQTLKDLIARAETEHLMSQRGLEQSRQSPASATSARDAAALASAAFRDPARLAPRIAFQDTRGLLSLPVSGAIAKAYGMPDGFGGTERGLTLTAGADAVVTAPSDGWVMFTGPFRSYGRVLIINAGNGYTFVMTGLHHTSVENGQFVLAGEPVGSLGPAAGDPGKTDSASGRSSLYVELRKDGQPIDPSPWWAKKLSEKARG